MFIYKVGKTMIETKRFRDDHTKLLSISSEISENLNINALSTNARKMKSLISDLLSYLNIHLLVEDKALYPRLIQYPNKQIQESVKKSIEESGHIKDVINKYKQKWISSIEIQNDPDNFIKETNKLLDALLKRIEKEDNHLYDLVDKVETHDSK